jgi:hypothetical protein
MSTDHGVIPNTRELLSVWFSNSSSTYKEYSKKIGFGNSIEVSELNISTKSNKNNIIISLESLERGYLSDKMSALTSNLRRLKSKDNWSYFDIQQNEGSSWTSASLYTTLTGFPAFFAGEHNSIFQSFYDAKIPSLFNVFNKLGHTTIYLVDNAKYSGTENMLYALGVDEIIDRSILGDKIQDKDLFDEAKNIALRNFKNEEKFTLFLSTLSTHFPNGIYDARMEKFVDPKKTDLEFMVAATDYLIHDFLLFLEENDMLENTNIFIIPDHLKMGNPKIFEGTGERGLYLLTNTDSRMIEKESQDLYQLDLPKLILSLADIDHNILFLSEQIVGDKNQFIKNNLPELTQLNLSGFSTTTIDDILVPKLSEDYEKLKQDTMRFIAHGGGMIDHEIYTNSLEALNYNYKKGFRLFELDFRKTSDNKIIAVHEWEQWSKFTKYDRDTPVSYQEFMNLKILEKYSPMDMEIINQWFLEHDDATLITDKINTPKEFSAAFKFKDRLMMELFSWEAVEEALENNIIPIVSENVIFSLKNNVSEQLRNKGIEYVAMSRESLVSNRELFLDLKDNGIKVYAYHINYNIDKDEEYAVKYEMDYYYGIYADKWFSSVE